MMSVRIPALHADAMHQAWQRQQTLLKPPGALGKLETLSVRLVGMTGRLDWFPARRAILVFAGDHGVMAHQVSTVPQAITAYMIEQFLAGRAAINVLAQQMRARVTVVDTGVNADLRVCSTAAARFVDHKIAYGTVDFTQGAAMTAEQARRALQNGADVVAEEIAQGLHVLVLGEMGIGNTTSASAIIAALTGLPVAQVTGRGTGIDAATLARKCRLIEQALALHHPAAIQPLQKVGGFEIAALAGAMLYAASQRLPVVLDGLICTAAALLARQMAPAVVDYLIAGHCGAEPGHRIALRYLGLEPLLDLQMRLGEGSGAALALPLVEAAMRTLHDMGTLDVG